MAIDPRIRRVGFAYCGGNQLLESGIKNIRNETPKVRVRRLLIPLLVKMLDKFAPDVLLIPDVSREGVRRSRHIVEAIRTTVQEASNRGIGVYFLTDEQVKSTLKDVSGNPVRNRHEIHQAIVERFPELSVYMPRVRQIWDSEPYFTPMFHAVAMYCAWRDMAHVDGHSVRT